MVNKTSQKELLSIILFDLGCLDLIESEDNRYRIKLLKGNIKDLAKTTESNKCFSLIVRKKLKADTKENDNR